jgi:hypothetical protein
MYNYFDEKRKNMWGEKIKLLNESVKNALSKH